MFHVLYPFCSFGSSIFEAGLMYTLYAWAPNETGDRVKILFERTKATMIMPTLDSMWKATPPSGVGGSIDVVSVGSTSPASVLSTDIPCCAEPSSPNESSEPRNHMPLCKEQQALGKAIQAALFRLKGPEGMMVGVGKRQGQMQLLQAAALDVLDAEMKSHDVRALWRVVDAATQLLDQCASMV